MRSSFFRNVVWFLSFLALAGCTSSHKNSCIVPPQAHGFTYSPLGFPVSDTRSNEFFSDIENLKDAAVLWNGPWRDDSMGGSDAGKVPVRAAFIADSAIQFCYVPNVIFEWRNGSQNLIQVPSNSVNDWTNIEARDQFIAMLKTYVNQYRPPYVFLGNENDIYYETNTADYANWIIAYNLAYDAIKQVVPETLVGPVFSFEHISGQGVFNHWNTQFWQALDDHDLTKVDVVGITVFPFFEFAQPENIPSSYLKPLFDRIPAKPVVIAKTGWPASSLGMLNPEWITTEEAQVTYVRRLKTIMSGRKIPVVNWLYYDGEVDDGSQAQDWKIFGSISIKDSIGIDYQVYLPWVNL